MSNIILTEKEIKILLINSLQQAGIELEDVVFKQKVQLFGPGKGIEITAELVKKQSENEVSALLNKLTYQQTNNFVPVGHIQQQPHSPEQPVQQAFGQPVQQAFGQSVTHPQEQYHYAGPFDSQNQ